jgi:hypothetical protein
LFSRSWWNGGNVAFRIFPPKAKRPWGAGRFGVPQTRFTHLHLTFTQKWTFRQITVSFYKPTLELPRGRIFFSFFHFLGMVREPLSQVHSYSRKTGSHYCVANYGTDIFIVEVNALGRIHFWSYAYLSDIQTLLNHSLFWLGAFWMNRKLKVVLSEMYTWSALFLQRDRLLAVYSLYSTRVLQIITNARLVLRRDNSNSPLSLPGLQRWFGAYKVSPWVTLYMPLFTQSCQALNSGVKAAVTYTQLITGSWPRRRRLQAEVTVKKPLDYPDYTGVNKQWWWAEKPPRN